MKRRFMLMFGVAFLATLVFLKVADSETVQFIWNAVFDEANSAIRVVPQ